MKAFISIAMLFLAVLFTVPEVQSTEYMALTSGNSCSHCHLDPRGGGELTADGEAYLEQLYETGDEKKLGIPSKVFLFITGYLHILFAVFWFGTILYVHIVLKPSYAAQGLPRGEKIVGVLSFWIVGITGVILTLSRISSWHQLFDTRFGILLTVKALLYLLMMVSAIFVIKILSPRLGKKAAKEYVPGEPFTTDTLSAFDGKDGRPCYFAFQGKVYDASESKMWPEGQHMKRHAAGTDLTNVLSLAPHDEDVMTRLKVVGEFTAGSIDASGSTDRHFFFIANMNLGIVLIILFILALWKWG